MVARKRVENLSLIQSTIVGELNRRALSPEKERR